MYRTVGLVLVSSCIGLTMSSAGATNVPAIDMPLASLEVVTAPGYSPANYSAAQNGSANQTAAEKLQARLADLQSLQGTFTQEIFEDGFLLQELQGDFVLERPARLRWVTAEPEASVMIADGETLWYYNPFIEQVTLFNQTDAMQSNPLLLLLENDQRNWEAFAVTLTTKAEAQTWTIKDEQDPSGGSVLELVFEHGAADGFGLTMLRLKDTHGQESVFQLSNIRFNQAIANQAFELELPVGTDIDDQR